MKTSFKIAAICFLLIFGSAKANDNDSEKAILQVKSKFEKVKVYCQASTSAEIITVLEKDETIDFIRKSILNGGVWSIVYVNGSPGYVLTSEIYVEPQLVLRNRNKKVKTEVLSKAWK